MARKKRKTSLAPGEESARERILRYLKRRRNGVRAGTIAEALDLTLVKVCHILKEETDAGTLIREGERCHFEYRINRKAA